MKRKFFCIVFVSAFLPLLLFSQSDISGYKLMYSKLNEDQLHYQKLNNTEEIVVSSLAITGGIVIAGLGASAGIVGYKMFTSEPFIDLDDEFSLFLFPITFTILFIQYVGGIALAVGGGTLCFVGGSIAQSASGNIYFQMQKNRQIQLELKKFKSVSQDYRPGVGIGISFPLSKGHG